MANEALEKEKEKLWQEQAEAAHRLEDRGIDDAIAKMDHIKRRLLFARANAMLGCMDDYRMKCGFSVAGMGMLIPPEDQEDFLKNCRKLGVQGVTHHENCDTAQVYAERIKSAKEPAEVAIAYSGGIAAKLEVSNSYIPGATMDGPKYFHAKRFAYYDGTTKGLDLTAAPEVLPNGYVLTRQLYPKVELAVAEARFAFDMASGQHGFGSLIAEEEPFVLIAVADPINKEMSLNRLMDELSPLASNRKIRITGIIAPLAEE